MIKNAMFNTIKHHAPEVFNDSTLNTIQPKLPTILVTISHSEEDGIVMIRISDQAGGMH